MALVRLAQVARPHGVEGEVSLGPSPLSAAELQAVRRLTWQGRDGTTRELTLLAARGHAGRVVMRFAQVTTLEQAAALGGGWLFAEGERLPDPGPGHAYHFQLIGFDVVTEEGRRVGTLEDIWGTGAHDVYVVRGHGEVLIPAVPEFLKAVSMGERRITVRLLPGMEEEAAGEGE